MKCYKFISLLAVFFAVTTLTHAQNTGPCTGSEYATDAEFFRAYGRVGQPPCGGFPL